MSDRLSTASTSTGLRILAAGPGITIQDGGRHGFLRFGVTAAGPMDPLAHGTANHALGLPREAATIEVSIGGVELGAEGEAVTVAIAGGAFNITIDGRSLPPAAVVRLVPGAKLSIRPGVAGSWCYVAVAGHLQLQPTLGSVSIHTRSGLGGRALAAGDMLTVSETFHIPDVGDVAAIDAPWLQRPGEIIRVVLGPQDDYFDAAQIAAFVAGPWEVSSRSDRMAYLLEGPQLTHAKGFNIVSDGIAMGAIQVPGDGKPLVLMADRGPTGGYPKIANVISADLGALAQLRAGAKLRFAVVTIDEAVRARKAEAELLSQPITLTPLMRTDFPSEFLLSRNLIDGGWGS
jgi:biotin-dependent carboxylase-like uncharacterized protein